MTSKVAGSIPVWGSEIVFLSIGLDDHSPIILRYFHALIYLIYKLYSVHVTLAEDDSEIVLKMTKVCENLFLLGFNCLKY